ncbi:MAG: sugar kinase [Chloroflexi bacterium]|nr:sugar kinase [Chloroflexota bacterium]
MIDTIVVVTRKTQLEELVLRLNSRAQARFYLEQNGVSFTDYEQADSRYHQSVEMVLRRLPRGVKRQVIDRDMLPTYQFGTRDLVLTIGPDGLVINTAKYLASQPILAVNPDPSRIDGVLIPFGVAEAGEWVVRVLEGKAHVSRLAMARATLNDGQTMDAVNDLFIGARTHVSARYSLELAGRREDQISSGIIVSTGAGCTGWMRSVATGAWQVARHFVELEGEPPGPAQLALGWEAERLWFAVREPFVSKISQANQVFGQIVAGEELVITSRMADYGVIFSDGIESDHLAFNTGLIARIGVADRRVHLVARELSE